MIQKKFLSKVFSMLIIASLVFGGVIPAQAKNQPAANAACQQLKNKKLHQGKITAKDRKAAADCAAALGLKVGTAMVGSMAPISGGTPDYFGATPNWAYSPLPQGNIASLTVDAAGSGYTAPVIDISDAYGNGSGATATAALDANSAITGFTITNAGAGYVAPRWSPSQMRPG